MTEYKKYSFADVAQYTGKNGGRLWVVYKDDVLDLTEFQNEHPDGAETILEEGGKDCTKAFDDVGHSGDAKKMMQKYKVGEIVEEEKRYRNGKRIVTVKEGGDGGGESRSCVSIVTCGLIGG